MNKVRIGVFGAGRGMTMINQLFGNPDARIVAVCDKYPPLLERCRKKADEIGYEGITFYTDFESFFNHDFDAVVLANYAHQHVPYALRFLRSGRHVMSEVLTMSCMKEAVELIEAVEETGLVYTYAENYCYTPVRWEMRRLYREGALGRLMYAEGEYLHDCSPIWPKITYGERDHWRNLMPSTFYCTHSIGPILYMTGLRPVRVCAFETPNMPFMHELGTNSGTLCMEAIVLDNGAILKSAHFNIKSNRHSNYQLNGDLGGCQDLGEGNIGVYLEKPGENGKGERKVYKPDPPIAAAATSGHGGGDYYTTHYFVGSILGDPDSIDHAVNVYQAVDMCLPGTLGLKSLAGGNIPIDIPDLRNKSERDAWRNDTACSFPEIAGDMYISNNLTGAPDIPDEVYDRVREAWLAGK
ncbi:MAG: Gfo/Idh/MocA family oxidoreductase [Clostridia bacterium]|nr:Gfo/Idh/MocA family oxidoreductase [Clostridia bacterium]